MSPGALLLVSAALLGFALLSAKATPRGLSAPMAFTALGLLFGPVGLDLAGRGISLV